MNVKNCIKWGWIGLLAAGCALATGCGGDDGDGGSGGGGTVVTNGVLVPGSGGTVVTNFVVTTNASSGGSSIPPLIVPDDDSTRPPLVVLLAAPKLIAPANNRGYPTSSGLLSINFQWTAVPGAKTYVLELNDTKYVTDGTGMTRPCSTGNYTWRVWAQDAHRRDGIPSVTDVFAVVPR